MLLERHVSLASSHAVIWSHVISVEWILDCDDCDDLRFDGFNELGFIYELFVFKK